MDVRQALHIASFGGSWGSCSPMTLKPLESLLFYSAFNVFSAPKQEYCFQQTVRYILTE